MVVDDDPDIRLLVSKRLSVAGFEVRQAESGARALEVFAEFAPEIIFLDVMMPHMDGFETSDRIRIMPGGSEVPIAFFTAHGSLDNHKKAMEHGSNDFISKPVSGTELVLRAKNLLRMKRLADELRQQSAEVSESDSKRRELIASIHARLGVPITDIHSHATSILEEAGASEATQRMAMGILKSAETLEDMVTGLVARASAPSTPAK